GSAGTGTILVLRSRGRTTRPWHALPPGSSAGGTVLCPQYVAFSICVEQFVLLGGGGSQVLRLRERHVREVQGAQRVQQTRLRHDPVALHLCSRNRVY